MSFYGLQKQGTPRTLLKVLHVLVAVISVLEVGPVLIFPHEWAIDQSIQGHQRPTVVFKSVWLALDQ